MRTVPKACHGQEILPRGQPLGMSQLTTLFYGFTILTGLGVTTLVSECISSGIRHKHSQVQQGDHGGQDFRSVDDQPDVSEDEALNCLFDDLRQLKLRILEVSRHPRFISRTNRHTLCQLIKTLNVACECETLNVCLRM